MRLVDIESKEFLEKIELNFGPTVRPLFKKILSEATTIDAVPVVRCKECQYRDEAKVNKKGFLICPASGMEITNDDFCSYGERRSDG